MVHYTEIIGKKSTYHEHISNCKNEAFVFRKFSDTYIHDYRHLHPESEIIYIHKGRGRKIIGDISMDFEEKDLCLINGNIPHYYIIDPLDDCNVEAWVIHFNKNILGPQFLDLEEVKSLKNIFHSIHSAYNFTKVATSKVSYYMRVLEELDGMDRLITFMKILKTISANANYSPIEQLMFMVDNKSRLGEDSKLQIITKHIHEHYRKKITITDISEKVHLSKPAVCNIFKKFTHTTLTNYISNVRLSEAAKLLAETDLSIGDVCYKSGFQNVSYFNRRFRQMYKMSPKEYRNSLRGYASNLKSGIEI